VAEVEVSTAGTVSAAVGDELVIRLPENGTTGYVWTVRLPGEGLELVSDAFAPGPGAVGASGVRLIRIRVAAPGRSDAVFRLGRPWEQDPVEQRHVTVVASG
jgi:inhibitor of cysteine peptidase